MGDRPGHDRRYAMNAEKIRVELGWKPTVEFMEGLRLTVHWYLENEDWVKAIIEEKDFQIWQEMNYAQRGEAK